MLQEEYYVIESAYNDSYPSFSWDEKTLELGLGYGERVECNEILKFRLDKPYPSKSKWNDYHSAPDCFISPGIAAILAPLEIYGIDLFPCSIRHPRELELLSRNEEYAYMHVWNRIECLDNTQSELDYLDENNPNGIIFGIDKLVLDESVLKNIELKNRLVFELDEKISVLLMHQSIKEAIEAIEPKGIRFFKATEWNSDVCLD